MERQDKEARLYRERLLGDAHRPGYHFTVPDGNGMPGDPNGAFFAAGRYHLMYLYRNEATGGFHWGHVSSADLLHWIHHSDALVIEAGDEGCFSGGGFLDDDGTAYLSFWKFRAKAAEGDAGGIAIAWSKPPYETWHRMPQLAVEGSRALWGMAEIDGKLIGCADPSNIWKENGVYYLQAGNKEVLDRYGRADGAPDVFRGDWTELYRSEDLKAWHWAGRFYQRLKDGATLDSEDDMCPSFLPLPDAKAGGRWTGKYLQLFISHNRGCQYYIGEMRDQRFYPATHGRMSWTDDTVFAPEACIDNKSRHLMWAWLRDDLPGQFETWGWCGVYTLPRVLWLRENGTLGIAPAGELEALRTEKMETPCIVDRPEGKRYALPSPGVCEIQVTCASPESGCTLRFMERENGDHVTAGYDPVKECLFVDAVNSGSCQRAVREEAPLALAEGEPLRLTVYLDQSVVELFANDRQAIVRRVYNSAPVCAYVTLMGTETSLCAWALGGIIVDSVKEGGSTS